MYPDAALALAPHRVAQILGNFHNALKFKTFFKVKRKPFGSGPYSRRGAANSEGEVLMLCTICANLPAG